MQCTNTKTQLQLLAIVVLKYKGDLIKWIITMGYLETGFISYRSSSSFVSYDIFGFKSFLRQQNHCSISYRILGPWDLANPVSFTHVHIVQVHFVPDFDKASIRKWLSYRSREQPKQRFEDNPFPPKLRQSPNTFHKIISDYISS